MPAGERRARTPHVRNETHPDPAGRFAVPGRYRLLVRLALACPAQHRRHRGIARRIRRHLCLDADHLRPGHPHHQDSAAYSGRREVVMQAEILSDDELADLTGYKHRAHQRKWLKDRNWVFVESRGGRPLVGRMFARMKLGMVSPTIVDSNPPPARPAWTPDFSRVN